MNLPDDLRYSADHEWAQLDGGQRCGIGITDYAQDALGDVVFVQVPTVGHGRRPGDSFSEVESTKSVSDIYAPVSGTIVAVNDALSADAPELVNQDPYGGGWLCEIECSRRRPSSTTLLDAAAYGALLEG